MAPVLPISSMIFIGRGNENDNVVGSSLKDLIIGESGNDELYGGAGNDELYGGAGNDLLIGGSGNDSYTGGDGADNFIVGDGHDVIYDFNRNDDQIDSVGFGGLSNLSGTRQNVIVDDEIALKLDLTGSSSITLIGYSTDDLNNNPVGSVTITGTAQQGETLTADATNLSDLDGLGTLSYQWLRDGVAIDGATSESYVLSQADVGEKLSISVSYTDGYGTNETVASVETDAVAPVDPVEPPAPIGPTAGDDLLLGSAQNDAIKALGGDDTINGLNGDDLLVGGGGNDNIKGGGGDDRLRGNGGDDTLKGGGGDDNIKGGGGDDNIKGGGGSDNIKGNGGSDVIKAGGGADTVKGGGGADVINGGGGDDVLQGGGGNDTITGKGGDDTLKGNGGADVFQFRASDRNDTILDFRQGQDLIEIQTGANSFAALDIEQDGQDVLIGFGTGQVRVVTDSVGAFDENDFIF